jgi:hypothetical protein
MPLPLAAYQPRDAERGVLYRVVEAHLDAFLDAAAEGAEGARLPAFIEQEFRDFLTCGVLAHGFARLRCGECAFERLVPFSCKGRGFCPSCGGRRMTESAAHRVEHLLPRVPVRQSVLSLPPVFAISWPGITTCAAPCSASTCVPCSPSSAGARNATVTASATQAV